MSQWGAYGYAKHGWTYKAILKHYYTGISFANVDELDRAREPAQRPERRQGQLPQRLHGRRATARSDHPGGDDRDHDLDGQRLQGGRRRLHQGLHRLARTFTPDRGLAAPDHDDRPRRRRRLPRHGQRRSHERRPHDGQQGAARELPARRGTARGLAVLAARGAQGAGVRGPRLRARQPRSRTRPGTCTATSATRPTWASASRTHAPTPRCATPPASARATAASPSWPCTSPARAAAPRTSRLAWPGASTIPYLKGVTDPYDTYATLHDWGPLRRTPSADRRARSALPAPCAPSIP